MLNTIKNLFGKDELVKVKTVKRTVATETRGRKALSKKQKLLNLLSKVSAVEVRFIPFDIWGEKNTTLSSTSIEDNGIGLWSDDGSWRASDSDAIQHYAMLGYVAQVKMASGEIKRANPDIVVKEAQAFSIDFSTSDLSVGE